jgi:hypothetical protein
MALIPCYECEKEISDKAPACPHCGAPKEEQPPQIEEAEILESVAVVDKPESITQETVSAPPPPDDPPHRWAILRLREKIDASGKSIAEYAQTTGIPRAPNTLYRWLRGESPIPRVVRTWLLDGFELLDEAEAKTTPEEEPK